MSSLAQNKINHIALVLDASISMGHLREQVIQVADEQIKWLAERSQRMDMETRITVYSFGSTVKCLVYDKDVLRLPSLRDLYKIDGNTALIQAVIQSQDDLAETPERYGEHSFLTFVITDGEENWSGNETRTRHLYTSKTLATRLADLPAHWTVAVMVPNQRGKIDAMDYGFPADNIAIWDSTSKKGVEEAGRTIQKATDNFMEGRTKGVRGTRSVFSVGADAVNATAISQADLKPLNPSEFLLLRVDRECTIKEFVEGAGYVYRIGTAFYQLTKREMIGASKELAFLEVSTEKVYTGSDARALVGLPDLTTTINKRDLEGVNKDFQVMVKSTSSTRKLVAGTNLVIMDPVPAARVAMRGRRGF